MKICVINGTPLKGVTYNMKEMFLENFDNSHEVVQYYPKDMPEFCIGCKNCFMRGENLCPHFEKVSPIWNSILSAYLIVFAYPVYALRAPASIKSLLDHLCVHWMVHRPESKIFEKTVVILTNSVGAPNGSAQKDVKTSFNWMGTSKVYTCGAGMMGDVIWDSITEKSLKMLKGKTTKLYKKIMPVKPVKRMSFYVNMLFGMAKIMHEGVLKTETVPSLDNQHYLDNGWIKDTRKK